MCTTLEHSILCETILLILLSYKNYLMNLHEIFRTHRYDPLPYLHIQHYHGYQSMLFLWQHICNTLLNFLTYWNITQKLFNQSSSNFQGKEILSSLSLTIVLLPWVSTNGVSIATYIYNILHVQYSIKMDIQFHQSIQSRGAQKFIKMYLNQLGTNVQFHQWRLMSARRLKKQPISPRLQIQKMEKGGGEEK